VPDFWPKVIAKAKQYHAPGRFVTFLPFEWGSWVRFGDKCVYCLGDVGPYFVANDAEADTPTRLWASSHGQAATAIPHHSKYGGLTDWDYHDEELQPVVEIYSMWVSSEGGSASSVQSAWEPGHRLGVIASSDNHLGRPGNPHCGLAADPAEELTREALYSALKARRCHATTGARILLDFRVDDVLMGAVASHRADRPEVKIQVKVTGTAPPERIWILRDNEVVYTHLCDVPSVAFRWYDLPAPAPTDLLLPAGHTG
jgi:hypothetical protein